jgi:hypothetical protein
MSQDPEIKAMNQVYEALSELGDKDSQLRVLQWISSKLSLSPSLPDPNGGRQNVIQPGQTGAGFSAYASIADLFAQVHAKTDVMRVLVAASYLQEKEGKSELTSREINHELTHLGHPSTNITRDLSNLIARKPKLVIQTRKDGKSPQAQKRYKVTSEGLKCVRELIAGAGEE